MSQEFGSLVNLVVSSQSDLSGQAATKVGDGATILVWSDRHAATVVRVTATQIHVQQDKATRIDSNGLSEVQSYQYESDLTSPVVIFRKTQKGWRSRNGQSLWIGIRQEYYDHSF